MACSTKTLKVCALVWDVIYALFGLAIVGVGVYVILEFEQFYTAAFIILGLGIVVILTAILGSLGASHESSRISKTFAIILILWAVLQTLTVGFFWIFQSTLLINVDKTFDQLWRNQPVPIKPENASQIASIERWLDCCGNVGPNDYMHPPYSCYSNDKLSLDGCRQKFLEYISDRWDAFNFLSIGLVLVELICAAFAWVLANSILNRWRRSKYYPK
ncbi:protein late bloomer [Anastrepha obliqua]|uniref:protein late bloomer n=1 Tax=Anastrepha ludens TaxID=28586 RepID=UPI0023B00045|nr:protein late bloomer [Anastrepha ludens]XP_053965158.1 protein late bloomer [Anastrepha ludens]XP_053965159.1 protein late bloomer [Anastrepha ludens]XP_054736473.1 protein late bloomer [Anastrepha obliqua]XP_054736474.1 protein late bloomer [Anastrepha obliqua]XP_054736476.1 protein late bloomer [Anastrepha obliqua]